MSLISDALRKARRDASPSPDAVPPILSGRPGRRRRATPLGVMLLVGALVGAALVAAGGAVVWWALSRAPRGEGSPTAATAPAADRAESPGGVTDVESPGGDAGRTEAGSSVETRPVAPTAAEAETDSPAPPSAEAASGQGAQDPALASSPAASTPVPARPDTDMATDGGRTTASPPSPSPAVSGEQVFVLDADLPDASLHLGYLVSKPEGSFAEINGRQVVEGSVVDGFVVEEIRPDRVVLRRGDEQVVLRTP